jgi:hypothetical protein
MKIKRRVERSFLFTSIPDEHDSSVWSKWACVDLDSRWACEFASSSTKNVNFLLRRGDHRPQIQICVKIGQSWDSAICEVNRGLHHLQTYRNQPHSVPVSQCNQLYWMVWKTFASTNSHLFVLLDHFSLQWRWNLRLRFCNSDESLNYKLSPFCNF